MSGAPLLCAACGAVGVPITRLVGYPTPEGHAALGRGDAEIVAGCTETDEGPFMPLRCRACRRLLAGSADAAEALASLALDAPEGIPAGLGGVWSRADGRALAWVSPLADEGSQRFAVPKAVRGLLLAARRPVVVLRVVGVAARFGAGRGLRSALREAVDLCIDSADPLAALVGDRQIRLALRLPRLR